MMLLSINLVYMLQAEPFEKIILTSYDITYVTKLRVPPIKSKYWPLSFIFIAFVHVIWKSICIWVFSTFNYLSNKANLKPLSFVVCLQQFVKHINSQVQPYHLNVSFLPYRCIKAVIILSYHRECSSFLYILLTYYKYKYLKFYFTFQNIFSASNVCNNT